MSRRAGPWALLGTCVCTRARRGTLPAHERVLGVPHLVARRVCSRALATLGLHPWVWMSYTLGCGTVLAL